MRRQFAWNIGAQAIGLILPPILLVALARLLEPKDFGVFALIMMVLAMVQALTLAPIGEVIIRSKHARISDFVFSVQLVLNLAVSAVILVYADAIAGMFNEPSLSFPLRVSCLFLIITPLVDTAIKDHMRKIEFQAVFARKVITPLANAMVSIPMALLGYGVWSLVWGQIFGIIAAAVIVIGMGGWRPRLFFKYKEFTEDIKFTWQMTIQSSVRWIRSQSDRAVLGVHITSDSLGQYDMARRLASLPFNAIILPVSQVLYTVMSDKLRKGENINDIFVVSQRRVMMISLPMCAALFLNNEGIIDLVLGAKWSESAPVFALMVIVGGLSSLVGATAEVFKARGRPEIMTRFMLVRAAATVIVFLWLAPKGVFMLSYGVLGLACFFFPINLYLALRLLKLPMVNYLKGTLIRPLLVTALVIFANLALQQFGMLSWQMTVLCGFVSGLIGVGGILLLERDMIRRAPAK